MPDQSADCIVTRVPGQYGREDSPAAYIDTMRDVFREARRVLADDGTCWLNLGDSHSASGGGATGMHAYLGEHITTRRATGMHAKNLLGLPWRVAFALQADGWVLRNAIIWHKPNAMPESVRGRLSCRHELLFLLVKSPGYWFDLDPIREPHKTVKQHEPGIACGRTRPPAVRVAYPAAEVRAGHARGHHRQPVRLQPSPPRPPERAQPRRRVVSTHAPLQRAAFRRIPDRPAATVHRRRL